MQLKGSFEPTSLASILQMLYNDGKTGELRLATEGKEVVLFLKDGNVIYAKSSQQELRLGTLLRSRGIITAQQLQDALAESKKEKMAMGSALVNMGFITLDVLRKVVRKQAEDAIYNVFLWDGGNFEYDDSKDIPKGVLVTRLDIMSIILEATRRVDEMVTITKKIQSDRIIFKTSNKFKDKEKLKFNAVEWRFLSLIDGTRTVRQLIDESGYEDFAVYGVLNSLISFGLIEKGQEAPVVEDSLETGYSTLVSIYTDILTEIAKSILKELGSWMFLVREAQDAEPVPRTKKALKELHQTYLAKWIARIFEDCKPGVQEPDPDIFASYEPDNPPDVFSQAVVEAMKGMEDEEQAQEFLQETFYEFFRAILEKSPDFLGVRGSRNLFREISKILRYVAKYQRDLVEESQIVPDIEGIIRRMERKLRQDSHLHMDPGKVFAIIVKKEVADDEVILDSTVIEPAEAAAEQSLFDEPTMIGEFPGAEGGQGLTMDPEPAAPAEASVFPAGLGLEDDLGAGDLEGPHVSRDDSDMPSLVMGGELGPGDVEGASFPGKDATQPRKPEASVEESMFPPDLDMDDDLGLGGVVGGAAEKGGSGLPDLIMGDELGPDDVEGAPVKTAREAAPQAPEPPPANNASYFVEEEISLEEVIEDDSVMPEMEMPWQKNTTPPSEDDNLARELSLSMEETPALAGLREESGLPEGLELTEELEEVLPMEAGPGLKEESVLPEGLELTEELDEAPSMGGGPGLQEESVLPDGLVLSDDLEEDSEEAPQPPSPSFSKSGQEDELVLTMDEDYKPGNDTGLSEDEKLARDLNLALDKSDPGQEMDTDSALELDGYSDSSESKLAQDLVLEGDGSSVDQAPKKSSRELSEEEKLAKELGLTIEDTLSSD